MNVARKVEDPFLKAIYIHSTLQVLDAVSQENNKKNIVGDGFQAKHNIKRQRVSFKLK